MLLGDFAKQLHEPCEDRAVGGGHQEDCVVQAFELQRIRLKS